MCMLSLSFSHVQLFVTPTDCSFPVHGILQVGILQWVVMPSSRGTHINNAKSFNVISVINIFPDKPFTLN